MNRLLIIGAFGDDKPTSSGQIIRTRVTYDELAKIYGKTRVLKLNTTDSSNKKLPFLWKLILSIIKSDCIMVIVSENGMRILYPILKFASLYMRKKILNSIVGGTVKPILVKYPMCRAAMKSFYINWVQLPSMIDELAGLGITNCEVLPNSKPLKRIKPAEYTNQTFKFCTFSRVSKEKGIEAAIKAIRIIHEKGYDVELDIYGNPDENYKDRFKMIMEGAPEYIKYRGVASYDKTTEVLKEYFMLLFPTTFDGEGFPGTLIDALYAGLPVIATNWKHNGEILCDGVTGYLYDYQNDSLLVDLIEKAVCNPKEINNMRFECINNSKNYSIDRIMGIICKRIDN